MSRLFFFGLFFSLSCFWLESKAFNEDAFIVDPGSLYSLYPDTLFENIYHRTLSPNEFLQPPVYTGTSFSRSFAKKHIKAGETVVEMSSTHRIDTDFIYSELPCLRNIQFSFPEEVFVMWLLYHDHLYKSTGETSPHSPFLLSLPRNIINPLSFDGKDWKSIKVTKLAEKMNEMVNKIRTTLSNTAKQTISQLVHCPDTINIFQSNMDEYIWAYNIVKDLIRTTDGLAIYPALNFAHSPAGHFVSFSDGVLSVRATKDIEPKEQIFVNYGEINNLDMVLYHSSFIENNPATCVHFSYHVSNPYWASLVAESFGQTEHFQACAPVEFTDADPLMIQLRASTATMKEYDMLTEILDGDRISLANDLRSLRALYGAIQSQILTDEELQTKSDIPSLAFWNTYAAANSRQVEKLQENIYKIWESHIGL